MKEFSHLFNDGKTTFRQIARCNDVVLMECSDERKKYYEIATLIINNGIEYYPDEAIVEPTIIKSREIYRTRVCGERGGSKPVKRGNRGRKPMSFFMEIPDGEFTMKQLAERYNKTPAYMRSIMTSRGLMDQLEVVGKIVAGRGKPELIYKQKEKLQKEAV